MAIWQLILVHVIFYLTYKISSDLPHHFRDIPMAYPFAYLVVDIGESGTDGVCSEGALCE